MSDDDSSTGSVVFSEIVSNVANESAKALAGAIGIDPMSAAAIGGAAGELMKGAETAFTRLVQRRQQRTELIREALTEVGGDLEQLLCAVMDDDRKLELLRRAFEVAQRTADLNRVRFYGRIAAEGILAADDAVVDEKDRVFSSIAALDTPDLKVLLHMSTGEAWQKRISADRSRVIADEMPEVVAVIDAVFSRLDTLGLISGQGEGGLMWGTEWKVTEFGNLCVDELRRHGASHVDANTKPPGQVV